MSDASTSTSLTTPPISGDQTGWESRLDQLLAELQTLATEADGQPDVLLQLLRRLEDLHRTIQRSEEHTSEPPVTATSRMPSSA